MSRCHKPIKLEVYNEVLIIDLKTGQGLKELFRIVRPRITHLASTYVIDGQNTDDKIQDLEIKLYQIIRKFNCKKSCFATFMTNCLNNYIRNQIKRNNIYHHVNGYITLTTKMINDFDKKNVGDDDATE